MIEENDEHFDPLLDDVDMATHMEEDVYSESGLQNGLRGADVRDPSLHEKEGSIYMATRETPETPGEVQSSEYSPPRTNHFYNNCLRVDLLR